MPDDAEAYRAARCRPAARGGWAVTDGINAAQVVQRSRVVRAELDRPREFRRRTPKVALFPQRGTEARMQVRRLRPEPNRFGVRRDGRVELPKGAKGIPEIAVRLGVT